MESDLRNIKDLAKPFISIAEMRSMANERLLVQQSIADDAPAAVTPTGVSSSSALPASSEPPGGSSERSYRSILLCTGPPQNRC